MLPDGVSVWKNSYYGKVKKSYHREILREYLAHHLVFVWDHFPVYALYHFSFRILADDRLGLGLRPSAVLQQFFVLGFLCVGENYESCEIDIVNIDHPHFIDTFPTIISLFFDIKVQCVIPIGNFGSNFSNECSDQKPDDHVPETVF